MNILTIRHLIGGFRTFPDAVQVGYLSGGSSFTEDFDA